MSKFMIASEENQMHLAHYGVKGMKWRQHRGSMSPAVYTLGAQGQTVLVGDSVRNGAKRGAEKGKPLLNQKLNNQGQATIKQQGTASYATKDKDGNLVVSGSKTERDRINKEKTKAKQEKIKNKFKKLGERIKNTAKGLKK